MKVRRIVTGHDSRGKSVFRSDEEVAPVSLALAPGVEFLQLWGGDGTPTVPAPDGAPRGQTMFPPLDGYRVVLTMWPAHRQRPPADLDMAAAAAEAEQKLPGMLSVMERDNPGMHTTDTVDIDVVLMGEIVLELDDGVEMVLRTGDFVVQNGTRHRWHNRGDVDAVLGSFIVGARRTAANSATAGAPAAAP
jgi:mannose-6-phosphate isomerase-like protein (cupin superfamily)